jgi:hypothetical protein
VVRIQAFGITFDVRNDVELRGLLRPQVGSDSTATVLRDDAALIRERWSGSQSTRTRELRRGERTLLSVDYDASRGYLVSAPGMGAALVSTDGLEVCCAPGPDTAGWEAVLVGQVLPLVATVRGLEVFHAAGVVVGARAHMLCGEQGVGKTSLALQLVIRGAELLSDDVVALDDYLVAHPGGAVLYVRAPELRRLDPVSMPGLHQLGTTRGRAMFAAETPGGPRPLGGIYLLERATAGPVIEPVPYPSPLSLLGATFNLSVRTAVRLSHHLELCARVAEVVPIFRARIFPGCDARELASALATHIEDRGAVRA